MPDASEPSSVEASSGDRNDDDGSLSPHHVKEKEQQSTSSDPAPDKAPATASAPASDKAPAADSAPATDSAPPPPGGNDQGFDDGISMMSTPPPGGSDQGSDDGISMMGNGDNKSEQARNGDNDHQARSAEQERVRGAKPKRLPLWHNSFMTYHQSQKKWDQGEKGKKKGRF
ncbi:hypothetical protein MMC22_011897 [Lobaria immixta]|nr:hypothetical protein [Lobaria immixta]